MKKTILTLAAACAFLSGPFASAVPITMKFTATGFTPGAPEDPVSGTLKWDADSPHGPVKKFTSIDLKIAGHTYSLGDIGFATDPGNSNHAATGVPSIGQVDSGTDDFVLSWFLDSLMAELFSYASTGSPSTFITRNVSFQVTTDAAASLPAPANGALLVLALGSLALLVGCSRAKGRSSKNRPSVV